MANHTLYRHFNSNGDLLYIGITNNVARRTKDHDRNSYWFSEVARIDLEHFESRDAVLAAETDAIGKELPKYNIQKTKEQMPEPEQVTDLANRITFRIVNLKPLYTTNEAASLLSIPPSRIKDMCASRKIGCVITDSGIRNTRVGKRQFTTYGISGWHIIEYIENLESRHAP